MSNSIRGTCYLSFLVAQDTAEMHGPTKSEAAISKGDVVKFHEFSLTMNFKDDPVQDESYVCFYAWTY